MIFLTLHWWYGIRCVICLVLWPISFFGLAKKILKTFIVALKKDAVLHIHQYRFLCKRWIYFFCILILYSKSVHVFIWNLKVAKNLQPFICPTSLEINKTVFYNLFKFFNQPCLVNSLKLNVIWILKILTNPTYIQRRANYEYRIFFV